MKENSSKGYVVFKNGTWCRSLLQTQNLLKGITFLDNRIRDMCRRIFDLIETQLRMFKIIYKDIQIHLISPSSFVKTIYAPCILRKGICDQCRRILAKTVMLPAFFEREYVINVEEYLVKTVYAPCILRNGVCDKCRRIFDLIFETVKAVQANLSKIRQIDPGDRYLIETQQEC